MRKCKRVISGVLLVLSLLLSVFSYAVPVFCSAPSQTVTINQGGVGHDSGCTVCSYELMLQNSGTLNSEYQLSGTINTTSDSTYNSFDKAVASNGAASGDAWVKSGFVSCANALTGATWTIETDSDYTTADGGITGMVGIGSKDFLDMMDDEVWAAMATLYNNGYFVLFCVSYTDNPQSNNTLGSYGANHATYMAGVDTSEVYLNDPANGSARSYSSVEKYQLSYVIAMKNDKTTPISASNGTTVTVSELAASSIGVSASVANGTYYGEEDLSAYVRLSEVDVSAMLPTDRSGLSQDNLANITNWERNVTYSNEEKGFLGIMRTIVAFIGIAMIVYAPFLYIAFWFDKLNVFFDFDLLGVITLGRFSVAYADSEITWGKGGKKQLIGHKQLVTICLTLEIFGFLLITGWIYVIINKIIGIAKWLLNWLCHAISIILS